ncbi:MAG: hypothetical protein PHN56_07345 [Candidatus Nanoarchaeia archaeon]|nr:hypothetical protein [Candidatus Nanoarchaeia archaeon]
MSEEQIVLNKVEYPDSIELDFGGTRKSAKLYFNASDLDDAKKRLENMSVIGELAKEIMNKVNTGGKNNE